ncbi:DUF58 domain-containing protein [Clostridium sp. SYSU_GA19001]|uniref:DUF58 domain-containing protein n=1 Tax=Clostridium caldaquaticum TaxID=2940653 RepID=UPI0020770E78|nr:DUF58 domain-containing protein [Clostridium caldaquaticum]MCM8710297.1 DUF58 domain-containing protein [Clostridium caldaquaticum]
MSVTKRFVYILSLGLIILTLSVFLGVYLSFFIIYNLICAVLLIIDYFISPKENSIEIERIGDEKLSIYENEAVSFSVYNKNDFEIYVELKDEMPEFHFKASEKIMKGKVPPHEKREFYYIVVPKKRGAFVFKNVHVRYEGKLKLCMKMFKVKLERDYKVYPNIKNLRKYRLTITNNRNLRDGQRNLKMLGKGTSFESLREYVTGDEYRKINWKATARGQRPIVNQYEPEKNQHVYIFVDSGRPMSYTVRGNRKLDLAINTALVLSEVVNQNGDKSALLLFNTKVNSMIMPGKGAGHRNTILETLYHIESTNLTSNYDEAFYYFKRNERHRSIIFLFTDFETVEEAESMLKVLPIISKNNLIIIIVIKNESVERIASDKINNTEDLFNKGVALELLNERKKIISLLNKRGVLCIECEAEKLEYTAVNKYIQVKNKSYM